MIKFPDVGENKLSCLQGLLRQARRKDPVIITSDKDGNMTELFELHLDKDQIGILSNLIAQQGVREAKDGRQVQ